MHVRMYVCTCLPKDSVCCDNWCSRFRPVDFLVPEFVIVCEIVIFMPLLKFKFFMTNIAFFLCPRWLFQ